MYSSYTTHSTRTHAGFQEPEMQNQHVMLPPLNRINTTTPPPPPPPLPAPSSSLSSFAGFQGNKVSVNTDFTSFSRFTACRPTPRNSIAGASGKPFQITPRNSIVSLSGGGISSLPQTPAKNYLFTPKYDSSKIPFGSSTPRAESRLQPPLLMLLDVVSSAKPLVPKSTSPSFYHYECEKTLPLLPPRLPPPSSSPSDSSINSFMDSSSAVLPQTRLTLPSFTWHSMDKQKILEPAIVFSNGNHTHSQDTVRESTSFSPNTSFVFMPVSSDSSSGLSAMSPIDALSPRSSSLSPLSPMSICNITTKKTKKTYRDTITSKPAYKHALKKGHCEHCGQTETTEWRQGPYGLRTMCNACGTYYTKMIKNFEYSYKCSPLEACERANLSVYYMKYHEKKTGKTGRKEVFQVPYYDGDSVDNSSNEHTKATWKSQVAYFVPFEVDENYYKITDKTHDQNKVRIVKQRKNTSKTDDANPKKKKLTN